MGFSTPHPERFSMSDEALVGMLKHDHEWAFKEIFTRYNLRLYQLAVGVLHDEALAKDLVQDVFIDVWNRRSSSDIKILSHYLVRAIKFQVLKQLRNGKVQEHHLQTIQKIQFVNQTEESLDFQEMDAAIKKIVSELPPRCKEIFILSRFENLSHKEISAQLNISCKTVEVQVGKALSVLRSKLNLLPGLLVFLNWY